MAFSCISSCMRNIGICCFCHSLGTVRKYSSRFRNRNIVLLLVGLDNAGKSSAAKGLANEPVDTVLPTMGFSMVKLSHHGYMVAIYDLGGGPQIRGIWHRYFTDVHGVIFVVDASDVARLDESRKVLDELLSHDKLAKKPVLILANKQDRAGALDELDIVERLNIEQLVNQQQCPTLVETCSAVDAPKQGAKRKLDPGIENGYKWLLRQIVKNYSSLNNRVMQDMEVEAVKAERVKEEWRLKNRRCSGEDREATVEGSTGFRDPFKPINSVVNDLTLKPASKEPASTTDERFVDIAGNQVALVPATSTDSLGRFIRAEAATNSSSLIMQNGESSGLALTRVKLGAQTELDEQPASGLSVSVENPSNNQLVLSATSLVREQLEWKSMMQHQRKHFSKLLKNNKTEPVSGVQILTIGSAGSNYRQRQMTAARPSSAKSLPPRSRMDRAWGLDRPLDVVSSRPRSAYTQPVSVLRSAHSPTPSRDSDDVIVESLDN